MAPSLALPPISEPRVERLPALSLNALITPSSVNTEDRTVDLVFTTGAAVQRYDWRRGTSYWEKLSMEPAHVRLDRLNSGAPLLDTHAGWSLQSMLGAVVRGSAEMKGKKGLAKAQFSRREEVEPVFQDVCDGVICNVSVGYIVHKYEETPAKRDGDLPTRTAIDWEPYEISMVPMPADPGAQTRSGHPGGQDPQSLYPCEIVTRAAAPDSEVPQRQERAMDPVAAARPTSETIAERDPLDPGAPAGRAAPAAAAPAQPTDLDLGAAAERARITGITNACRAARMPTEVLDRLIREQTPLVDAQATVFEELRRRGAENVGPQMGGVAALDVRLTNDPMVHVRAGIENALAHRLAPGFFKLDEVGRKYRGLTLLDVARCYLQAMNIRTTEMSRNDLAGAALGITQIRSTGMHATSDFANLLADVAHKTLRAAYEEQPQTFKPLVKVVSLTDFKPVSRVQLGDAPALLEIGESGEYKSGTISDGKVQYQLTTYGRKFAITRQALINDDTDAFSRVPQMFGRKARVLESNLVWACITGNPQMGDGAALFHASHANLADDGDHISVESLGRARAALRQQTSLDGDYLNLTAMALLVPTGLETKADQFVTVVTPQEAGKVNPFQNKLQVIADPRLDANSATAWYLAASPSAVDIIELGYLEGDEGPNVESMLSVDVDGLIIKARLDVVAKAIDWRGLYKDPGDLSS